MKKTSLFATLMASAALAACGGGEPAEEAQAPAVSDNLASAVTNAVADAVLTRIGDAVPLPIDPLGLLQGLLNALVGDVLGDLTGPVDGLLGTVFQSLGVQVAGADVTVRSVSARRPYLFAHEG